MDEVDEVDEVDGVDGVDLMEEEGKFGFLLRLAMSPTLEYLVGGAGGFRRG
jgi:hypothetical protein